MEIKFFRFNRKYVGGMRKTDISLGVNVFVMWYSQWEVISVYVHVNYFRKVSEIFKGSLLEM